MKRIIFMFVCCIVLSFVLSSPIQACEVEVEVVIGNIVERPAICGVEDPPCGDWAKVTMDGPDFNDEDEEEDGCRSDAKLVGPKAPDADHLYPGNCWVPAYAHAYGDASGCQKGKRGYGLAATPGWEVTAEAEAHVGTVVEGEVTQVKVSFKPCPAVIIVFTESAGGKVTVGHKITSSVSTEGEILLESYTEITDSSPNTVTDSTGLLTWERFTYEGYSNAFHVVEPCEPIVLREYNWYLDPNEEVEIITSMTTDVNILDVTGDSFVACITPGEKLCLLDSISGDLNSDCKVDFEDFSVIAEHWLEEGQLWPVSEPNQWCEGWECATQCHGDADCELEGSAMTGYYYVGNNDLNILVSAFGTSYGDIGYDCRADFTRDGKIDGDDQDVLNLWWQVKEPPHGPGVPADCPTAPN